MVQIFFITLSCKRNNNVTFGVLFDCSTYADFGNKIYVMLCYVMLYYVMLFNSIQFNFLIYYVTTTINQNKNKIL